MKRIIYSNIIILFALIGFVACEPHESDKKGLGNVISKDDIKVVITTDQENSNLLYFKLGTPECIGRFVCLEAGISDSGTEFSKLIGWSGDYILKVQVYNHAGLSETVEMPFSVDTDIYVKYLAGDDAQGKIWRIDGDVAGHIGCGPEDGTWNEWWSPAPNSLDSKLYDDDMTFYLSGKFYLDNKGASFMNESTAALFPDGDPGSSFITTHYTPSSTATWEIGRDETGTSWLEITEGFPAYAVNPQAVTKGKYKIAEITETTMKITYHPGGIAWHYFLTSKPR